MYITLDGTEHTTVANRLQPGYSLSTQAQIDAYQLGGAQFSKTKELKVDLRAWRTAGFVYQGTLPSPTTFNLSEQSATYVKAKNDATWTGPDRDKFYDRIVPRVKRDFASNSGFDGFAQAIGAEEDRIMVLYNDYYSQIEAATTVEEVDAITIDFNP